METPKKFSPAFITKTFFPEYVSNPSLINRGHCYDWAYVSWALYPHAELWSNRHHAWVEIAGRFFDSETTALGKKSWQHLRFFRETLGQATFHDNVSAMNIDQFKANWNTYGRYHRDKTMWQDMISRITRAGYTPVRT